MTRSQRRAQRERIRQADGGACAYCGVGENSVGAALTLDHFQPQARGGSDEDDNLLLCCHACNEFKGSFWSEQESQRLLHPRFDDVSRHLFQDEAGLMVGLSPRGNAHIARLHLNRPQAVTRRLKDLRETRLMARLEAALERVRAAEEESSKLKTQLAERGETTG
jgi:hypothetical protein